ncbi:MAG: NAD(P)H-hydrate dehydratase [Dehalococcoidales bacterium]|nr:NAD(P)H-hydrate dehydratase [Dehalococcoidales bacterium]
MKIVTAEEMRQIDRACIEGGTPASVLMENAGKAVAEATRGYLGALEEENILCLIGGGNNGGDGLVAARYLHEWGATVNACLCWRRSTDDENLRLARESGITCTDAAADGSLEHVLPLLSDATCIIDGLLGTGNARPLDALFKQVLEAVRAEQEKRPVTVIAIDMPSGMDADTGACDPACPEADLTVTLAFAKPGLFGMPGAARVGRLVVADIGIPEELADTIRTELMTDDWAAETLPQRPIDANKGTFGKLLAVAGSVNYTGAAYLACAGALRSGTGLVTLATAASLQPVIAAMQAEVTHLPLPESPPGHIAADAVDIIKNEAGKYTALLAGCGLGQDPGTVDFVRGLAASGLKMPLVLDADALNGIAGVPDWWKTLPDCILTPHPGELSRLCGLSIEEIQANRLETARKYAGEWLKIIVLKGAYTIVAGADGRCRISPFANAALASGGTGDVLAGIIGGLAAQGLPLFEAASLGVYLHGATAARLSSEYGDTGLLASDLLPELPVTIHDLKNDTGPEES